MDLEKQGKVKLKGFARVEGYDKDGNKKFDSGWLQNTIANSGIDEASDLLGNVTGGASPFIYLAVGTDSTTESATHTALQAEITDSGLSRVSATVTQETDTVTNDTLQLTYSWSVTGAKTIEEIGVFNDASAGTMLGRKLTGSKAVSSGDTFVGTYKIVLS